MEFENNSERNKYLIAKGKIILNACPGSGKTTTISYKLTQLVKEYEKSKIRFSGVACLSFTNVAKNEITEKFKTFTGTPLEFPHVVSTIDSFINNYITSPFIHLITKNKQRHRIIDNSEILNKVIRDNWWFYMNKEQSKFLFKYPPSKIEYSLDGTPYPHKGIDKSVKCLSYCRKIKDAQLKLGLIKSTDSEFFALQILTKFPTIGQSLIRRFPNIIIDEAQDTSEIQHAIFDKLVEIGLRNIEFIGDPYQSLYEFRDARPDLFYAKYRDNQNWQSLNLTNCRRSSQPIINCYEILRLNSEPRISSTANIATALPVKVIRYNYGEEDKCIQKYTELINELKDNQIVVRGKSLKNKLLGIKDNEEPWKSTLPYTIVYSKQLFFKSEIKAAINCFRSGIPIIETPSLDYHGCKARENELRDDYLINAKIFELLKRIPNFDISLDQWTITVQSMLKEAFGTVHDINFELKKGIWNKRYKDPVEELFGIPNTLNSIPVATIHKVKGTTVDSLLLILSDSSIGQNISLSDYFPSTSFPDEKQRLLYVAMSRPRVLLSVGIPYNQYTDEEIRQKLGADIDIYQT